MVKGLARSRDCARHGRWAKCVDAGPFECCEGRLLPNDGAHSTRVAFGRAPGPVGVSALAGRGRARARAPVLRPASRGSLAFVVRGGSGATREPCGLARTAPSLIAAPFRSARLAQAPERGLVPGRPWMLCRSVLVQKRAPMIARSAESRGARHAATRQRRRRSDRPHAATSRAGGGFRLFRTLCKPSASEGSGDQRGRCPSDSDGIASCARAAAHDEGEGSPAKRGRSTVSGKAGTRRRPGRIPRRARAVSPPRTRSRARGPRRTAPACTRASDSRTPPPPARTPPPAPSTSPSRGRRPAPPPAGRG